MSFALQEAVWRSALPARLRMTALAMARYANDDGESLRPAQETIVEDTGLSLRKVRNDIDELTELGILVRLSVGRKGRASRYRFVAAALPAKASKRRRKEAAAPPDNRQTVPPESTDNRQDVPVSTGKPRRDRRQNPSSQPAPGATDPVRGSGQEIRSLDPVTTHTPRARARARGRPRENPVSSAIRDLRETYEVAAIWTREDGDLVHALAEFVMADDVSRASQEVSMSRRPSWPIALRVLQRVAAARRDGRDPWPPKSPKRGRRAEAPAKPDPYAHLYRRD